MATYNPLGAYLESKILSASPLELVCLTYEEAIEAVRQARTYVQQKRIQERSRSITKAQLLIGELRSSLNFDRGGELSQQLASLYHYMQTRLTEANFKQAEEPLAEVETLLETILESWRELARGGQQAMASSAPSASDPFPSSYSSPWSLRDDAPAYALADVTL